MKTETLPFEEAAEHRTNISGWVCKTCRRFYGDSDGAERTARWCCAADLKCATENCEVRVRKGGIIYCDSCTDRRSKERWLKLPEVPWDGKTPLCLHDDDRFFFDFEDLENYIDDHENVKLEDLRLVICVHDKKPRFDMSHVLDDYLGADQEADDPTEIEKTVNDWIDAHVPQMWVPGRTRPTLESVWPS